MNVLFNEATNPANPGPARPDLLRRALRRRHGLTLVADWLSAPAAVLLIAVLIGGIMPALEADEPDAPKVSPATPATSEELDRMRADYEAMLAEFEVQRLEAVRAAEEARMQAEIAREIAREQAAVAAEKRELSQAERREAEAELDRVKAETEEKMRELRRQLSESHRQMREASREIARANRDLAVRERRHVIAPAINIGDRAVIGVVLGKQTDEGVVINGVSPDGPAERAGIREGDVLISLRGESLAGDQGRGRVFEIMSEVEAGEELSVGVVRDGETWDFMVEAEQREPRTWQSYIRIAEPVAPGAPGAPDAPVAPQVHIEIPNIDHEALAREVERVNREFEQYRYAFIGEDGEGLEILEDFDFSMGDFSEIANQALEDTRIWFGTPATHGLKFAAVNPELGAYFDTDRGVLVLAAKSDNAFELRPGDVVLSVNDTDVDTPSDVLRALRYIHPDEAFDLQIVRNKREETLNVVMPDGRIGGLFLSHPHERIEHESLERELN